MMAGTCATARASEPAPADTDAPAPDASSASQLDPANTGAPANDPSAEATDAGTDGADAVPEPESPPAETSPAKDNTPAEISDDLLGADPVPAPPPRRPPAPAAESVSSQERLARYYQSLYRPEDNPGMARLTAHTHFLQLGAGNNELTGRAGGLRIGAGQNWNWIGYSVDASLLGGRILVGEDQYSEINVAFGGGPSLALGRLSLFGRGFVDLALGYDFLYAPARDSRFAVEDGVAGESAFAPHGPRLNLDLGLLTLDPGRRRYRHGVGISLGYQAFVGSLNGAQMPFTSVLSIGLVYWMG